MRSQRKKHYWGISYFSFWKPCLSLFEGGAWWLPEIHICFKFPKAMVFTCPYWWLRYVAFGYASQGFWFRKHRCCWPPIKERRDAR